MATSTHGRYLKLSPARRMVMEILHHGRQVPSLPLSKRMRVGSLVGARQAGAFVSWTAIFMKAYALVAQRHPELRRSFIPYPRARLYEHPVSICGVTLEREMDGEHIVLGAKVRSPETQSLTSLNAHLTRLRSDPIHEIGDFRQWLRIGRLPGLLRRFVFWHTLYFSGHKRAKHFGTFAVSSLGNLGVVQHHPISPLTTYLTFGPIGPLGDVEVKIIYDHRVMDGRCIARALNDLEEKLNTCILDELASMISRGVPARSEVETREDHSDAPVSG